MHMLAHRLHSIGAPYGSVCSHKLLLLLHTSLRVCVCVLSCVASAGQKFYRHKEHWKYLLDCDLQEHLNSEQR